MFFSLFPVQVKRTPLHNAASAGHHEICKLLLEKGAHVDASDDVSATFSWEKHVMSLQVMSSFFLYDNTSNFLSNSDMTDHINLTVVLVLLPSTSSLIF